MLSPKQHEAYDEMLHEFGGCKDPEDSDCTDRWSAITISLEALCDLWLSRKEWMRLAEIYEGMLHADAHKQALEQLRREGF